MTTTIQYCLLCGAEAIAVFAFSRGCLCNDATVQPLCLNHAIKSEPKRGGSMELIEDLTRDGNFRAFWERGCRVADFPVTFRSAQPDA